MSDPRNSVILKIFSLINYGERAGSGLSSIFKVWEHVYHTPAQITEETDDPMRVIVTLANGGHEQDVKAMLELYDNPEELTFPNDDNLFGPDKVSDNDQNVRKDFGMSEKVSEKQPSVEEIAEIMSEKLHLEPKLSEKMSEKLSEIIKLASTKDYILASDVVSLLSIDDRKARRYLNKLTDIGCLESEGVTKNKKYRIRMNFDGTV